MCVCVCACARVPKRAHAPRPEPSFPPALLSGLLMPCPGPFPLPMPLLFSPPLVLWQTALLPQSGTLSPACILCGRRSPPVLFLQRVHPTGAASSAQHPAHCLSSGLSLAWPQVPQHLLDRYSPPDHAELPLPAAPPLQTTPMCTLSGWEQAQARPADGSFVQFLQ